MAGPRGALDVWSSALADVRYEPRQRISGAKKDCEAKGSTHCRRAGFIMFHAYNISFMSMTQPSMHLANAHRQNCYDGVWEYNVKVKEKGQREEKLVQEETRRQNSRAPCTRT